MLIQNYYKFEETLDDKLCDYYFSAKLDNNKPKEVIDYTDELILIVTFGYGEGNGTNTRRLAV
ncbi:MAG: hypothetical protein WC121_10995 [Candidatus Kapaibacterium sp.]